MSSLELFDTEYITENTIKELSSKLKEPGWLLRRRLETYKIYKNLPFDKDNLFYKYTTFRNFDPKTLKPSWHNDTETINENKLEIKTHEPHIVETGSGLSSKLPENLIEKGVIFCSLHSLLMRDENLAKKIMQEISFSQDFDKLGALAISFAPNPTILYVPKNIKIEEPLVKLTYLAEGASANFSEFIAYFDEGSEVTYVNIFQTLGIENPQDQLFSSMETVIAKDNTNIKSLQIQNWDDSVLHLMAKQSKLSSYAKYRSLTLLQGGNMSRHNSQLDLDGNGSEGYDLFATFGTNSQRFDVKSELHHNGRDTIGQTHARQVMMGRAESILRGLIVINESGVNADSWLTSQGMTLNKGKVTAIPALKIEQNEVKAAHAASVEPINKALIFYLETRGISKNTAREMLIKGYFEYVFKRIEDDSSIEVSREFLNQKWQRIYVK